VEPPPHPLQQPELKEVSPKREAEASSKTYEETASRADSQVQENGQKESDYVTKHPTVKYFLDTFDAQILAIEPIKKGKK
jgi:ABC-type Zn uptake system ZnuABC Zn-binding protein ZnuA